MDTMAVGLEEESKRSLAMEAELEKHLCQFGSERQQLRHELYFYFLIQVHVVQLG